MENTAEYNTASRNVSLAQSDPDLAAMQARLEQSAAARRSPLDAAGRRLVTLAVLAAIQCPEEMEEQTAAALAEGLSPVQIREAVYQCAPYIGFPKTACALRAINRVLTAGGAALPLESQATVTDGDRFEKGLAVQKGIFGNAIEALHASAPEGQKAIVVEHLSAFCFGDIYTRSGLDVKTRELLTFCIISALGGCESQVKSHVQGNAAAGNEKQKLIDALETCLPLMGFPRTLNALACVNAVMKD